MIKFKKLNGRIEKESSYFNLTIEGGKNSDSIGDQLWFSNDGTEMEISEHIDENVYEEFLEMVDRSHRQSFKGALRRIEISFD